MTRGAREPPPCRSRRQAGRLFPDLDPKTGSRFSGSCARDHPSLPRRLPVTFLAGRALALRRLSGWEAVEVVVLACGPRLLACLVLAFDRATLTLPVDLLPV